MFERVSIEALKPGMVIVQITQQNGPVRIRKSGLVNSDAMVTGLREMGVLEVEIDPQQTVEIQSDEVQSQTQFLLQSNSAVSDAGAQASTRQDSQLAEQFNRSLFLPTAQDIPDTWQVYTRRFGTAAAVIILGFGLGFGVAVGPDMWSATETQVALQNNGASTDANTDSEQDPNRQETSEQAESKVGEKLVAVAGETEQSSIEDNSLAFVPTEGAATRPSPEAAKRVTKAANVAPQNAPSDNLPVAEAELAPEQEPEMLVLGLQPKPDDIGTITDNGDLNQNPAVSKALLEKFQKVMSEMEQQQRDQRFVASQAPDVPEPEDVPRVDQMPQWVLASLPRLSFNAHMFATESADRWVKVNGKELGEGDWIDAQLRIQRIDPQHVILDFQGNEFSMKALSDW